MQYFPPTNAAGALHNCSTIQDVSSQGTIETTQSNFWPLLTRFHYPALFATPASLVSIQ